VALKRLPKKLTTTTRADEQRVDPLTLRNPPALDQLRSAFECMHERKGRVLSVFTEYGLGYYNQAGNWAGCWGLDGYDQFCTEIFWPQAEHTYAMELHRRRLIDAVKSWAGFIRGRPS
jgi:hypothetical protein